MTVQASTTQKGTVPLTRGPEGQGMALKAPAFYQKPSNHQPPSWSQLSSANQLKAKFLNPNGTPQVKQGSKEPIRNAQETKRDRNNRSLQTQDSSRTESVQQKLAKTDCIQPNPTDEQAWPRYAVTTKKTTSNTERKEVGQQLVSSKTTTTTVTHQ